MDSAIFIKSASVAASNVRMVTESGRSSDMSLVLTGVTGSPPNGVRSTRSPFTRRRPDSTVRPIKGYAGHTKARASGCMVRQAESAPAIWPGTDPRIVESIFRKTRSMPALISASAPRR